eukprot:959227-Prymnesium_polylepis.1
MGRLPNSRASCRQWTSTRSARSTSTLSNGRRRWRFGGSSCGGGGCGCDARAADSVYVRRVECVDR